MLSSMLCTPKSDVYPVLQNAVECSDFAELLILNLKNSRKSRNTSVSVSVLSRTDKQKIS